MLANMWRKRNHYSPLVAVQTGAVVMEFGINVLKKLKTELLYDPALHSWASIYFVIFETELYVLGKFSITAQCS